MKAKVLLTVFTLMTLFGVTVFAEGSAEEGNGGEFSPAGNVEWYCTSSPGGGSDIFTRTISGIAAKEGFVDTNFQITYNTDGAGEVGRQLVSRIRKGDRANNTLLTFNSGDLAAMVRNTNNRFEDFTPIAHMAVDKHLIYVGENSRFSSFKEVIAAIKAGEEIVLAGSKGDDVACYEGLIEELDLTRAQLAYIVNDSSSDAITKVLGGHVDIVISKPAAASQYVEAGKLVPILALAGERFPGNLSVAPTLAEIGDYDNVEFPNWRSVVGPKNMSPEAAKYWSDVLKAVSETDAWNNDYIGKFKLIPKYMGHEEYKGYGMQYQSNYMKAMDIAE